MKVWRVLPVVSAANVGLLAFGIARHSLWLDEVMSVRVASRPVRQMTGFFFALPEQHPLYYALLKGWMVAFGQSDASVRALSALFAAACVWLAYFAGRRLLGEREGRVAAVLMALSPFMIYYGQEARMYSLLAALTLATVVALARWLADGERRWLVAYVALAVLGVYTHLFFFFALAAQLCCVGLIPEWRKAALRQLFVAQVVVGISYLPWAALLVTHFPHGQSWKGLPNIVFGVPYSLMRFALGYAVFLANYGWKEHALEVARHDALLLTLGAIGYLVVGVLGVRRLRRSGPGGALTLAALVVPMVIALALSWITILVGERYFIVCFPFFVLVIAAGLVEVRESVGTTRRVAGVAAIAFVVAVGASLLRYYADPEFGKEQWAQVARMMRSEIRPGDEVVVYRGIAADALRRYYGPTPPYIRAGDRLTTSSLDDAPRVWLVVSHAPDEQRYVDEWRRARPVLSDVRLTNETGIRLVLLGSDSRGAARRDSAGVQVAHGDAAPAVLRSALVTQAGGVVPRGR